MAAPATPSRGYAAPDSVHKAWPGFDPELAKADMITLVVQVNGKVRDKIEAPAGITEAAHARWRSPAPPFRNGWRG